MSKLNKLLVFTIFFVLVAILTNASFVQKAEAKKPQKTTTGIPTVIDGDTIKIRGQSFRLFGIDAFESKQTCFNSDGRKYLCGNRAAKHLSDLISRRNVDCRHKGKSWDRVVAVCTLGDKDLGQLMVANGWALAWSKYSRRYLPDMTKAKSLKLGAWSGSFTEPWAFRKSKKRKN